MAEPDIDLFSNLIGEAPAPEDRTVDDKFIIDADTFVEDGTTVRIAGVDAPEVGKIVPSEGKHQPQQAGADLATDFLRELFAKGDVEVEETGDTTFGRQVAEVTVGGRDVGEQLIERGFARPTLFSGTEQRRAERTANVRLSGVFDEAFSDEDLVKNRQLEYEKEVQGFDPNYSNVVSTPDYARGTFSRATSRGLDNTQGLLYAAANAFGEFTGVDVIAEWGEEGMVRNMHEAALSPAEIGEFDNVESLADFGTYVLEAIGEQIPNIALTATGAGAAALTARAAIGKALLQKTSTLARRAPLLGAAATSYPLGVGEVQQELVGAGIEAPGTALVAGLPIAALDAASFDLIFGKLFQGVKRGIAEDLVSGTARALGFAKAVGKGGLVGGLAEMPTETLQEIITLTARAYHDPTFEIFSDENLGRLRETAIKAGIVGAAGGGFASGVQAIRELPPLAPVEPTVEPEPTIIPDEPSFTPSEPSPIEVASINSVPPEHMTQVEVEDGGVVELNTREMIQRDYDTPISNLEQLARCMGA